jgi:hypothetical protein
LAKQVRNLELALAATQAKLDAQQGIASELRAYLERQALPSPTAAP